MRLRKILVFAMLFSFCLLCSCSSQSKNNAINEEKNAETTTNTNNQKKSVTVGIEIPDGMNFDPIKGWGRYGGLIIQSSLLRRDLEDKLVPDLAKEYNISDNKLTYTFILKDNIKFSDGTPLTGEDIKFTYEKIKAMKSELDLSNLDSITVDGNKINFNLKEPDISFLYFVADTGIVQAKSYSEDYGKNPIGSGPYKLVEWLNDGEQAIFEKNDLYYGKTPDIEKLVLVNTTPDAGLALARLGKLDVLSIDQSFAEEKIDNMHLLNMKSIDNRGITLPVDMPFIRKKDNMKFGNEITGDISVRKALNYGVNRQKMVDEALSGYGRVCYGVCDGMPWSNPDDKIEYNPEKAKEILNQGGWKLNKDGILEKNGVKAELILYYNSGDEVRHSLCLMFANDAKALGINVEVKNSNWDEIENTMFSNPVLMGWGARTPLELYLLYSSKTAGLDDFYNPENFKNKTVDNYLSKAIESKNEDDSNKYFKLAAWDGNTGFNYKGDAPWVWLVNIDHLYLVRDKLYIPDKNIEPHGHGLPILTNVDYWKYE